MVHQSNVHLLDTSSFLMAPAYFGSYLWLGLGFVCTLDGGSLSAPCASDTALLDEAEATGKAKEELSTPAQLLVQSFGDGLCMIVGGVEFQHKGLSTLNTAPEKPPTLSISYSKN